MAKSKRAGARRKVLAEINEIRKSVATITRWWRAETTVYVEPADRKPGENLYLRPREEHEYPENDTNYWYGTIREIDEMMVRLGQLRSHCLTEAHKTERGVS